MTDPYSPTAGLMPRLVLSLALCVLVWAGVAWALA